MKSCVHVATSYWAVKPRLQGPTLSDVAFEIVSTGIFQTLWQLLRAQNLINAATYVQCASHFGNLTSFNILKESLLVQKQTLHQQKALDFSFKMAPWKWAWHYQEGVTMTCRKRTFFTSRAPMLFAARRRGALLMMPRPFSRCQIKAEIKGFLLMYRLFLYY